MKRKRRHWTQTPEGKLRLAQLAEARQARRDKGEHHATKQRAEAQQITFAAGYCTGWVAAYAKSAGLDEHDLASRVGQVLLGHSGWR